jgi:hypothetical protein
MGGSHQTPSPSGSDRSLPTPGTRGFLVTPALSRAPRPRTRVFYIPQRYREEATGTSAPVTIRRSRRLSRSRKHRLSRLLSRPSSASPERVGERFYGASIPCGSTCRQKRWPTASGDPQKTLVTEHRCRAAVREYLPRKAIFKASLRRRKRSERRRKSSLRCFYAEF